MTRAKLLRGLLIFSLTVLISLEFWSLYISIEDEAVIVVGSQRLLVIKRQRGALLHGTPAQRSAKTQTKQQTTI